VDDTRCGQAGRERCNGDAWVSEPCPLDTPACEQGECVLRGPSMVHVGSFYIDSTEVTVAQYREFLDYKGNDSSGQIDECSWNTAYWEDGRVFNSDSWPINWVDWCDAAAFCDWAGKRLCGRIGGGSINDDDFYDPTESEWILACGGPNGNSHVNGNWDCNTNGSNGYLEPVGSFEGCEGWYEGLFDMEGNVFEWTDNCVGEDGATDVCRLAGGSYVDSGSYCTRLLAEYSRDTTANPFGFRCCND
jgi:formylglycine-generating enzyme required for sulfatase activity